MCISDETTQLSFYDWLNDTSRAWISNCENNFWIRIFIVKFFPVEVEREVYISFQKNFDAIAKSIHLFRESKSTAFQVWKFWKKNWTWFCSHAFNLFTNCFKINLATHETSEIIQQMIDPIRWLLTLKFHKRMRLNDLDSSVTAASTEWKISQIPKCL